MQPVAPGRLLLADAAEALHALAADAAEAGFQLAVASAFRSFNRQLAIWNAKARGERPVHDDRGQTIDLSTLPIDQRIEAILRYSALPGASRHHWGTDLDIYDAAAVSAGYEVQLSPSEVAPGGPFAALHRWLDQRIAAGASYGFYRPYDRDRGGVAPERWHLSYAPLAERCEACIDEHSLLACWDRQSALDLCWRDELVSRLPQLMARYVNNVAPPPGRH